MKLLHSYTEVVTGEIGRKMNFTCKNYKKNNIFRSSPGDGRIDWNSGVSVRTSVRPYCTSTKSFSNFDLIWCVHRPRPDMRQYDLDPIQGQSQGHGACEVAKIALF